VNHFFLFFLAVRRWAYPLALLFVGTLVGIPADAEQSTVEAPVASPTAEELLAAGDQLVEEKNYDEALLQYKDAYELIVPQLRLLPFREPVAPRLMLRSELKDYMAAELAKEVPPPLMKRMDRSLKVLGLIPETLDVRETLLNLLTEEVGGFYNPRTKEMFLIREDPVKRTFLSRLLKGPDFNAEEQRVTLAHEMTHALADQHFDLVGLDRATGGNDDMAMAVSSLVEGEATLVMMGEMFDIQTGPELLIDMQPERIDATFRLMNWVSPFMSGRTMRNAPSIFRQTLVFPYHKGTVFTLHLTNQGGWESVNAAFRQPPLSSEQILHPEKYLGPDPDWPTAVELPRFTEHLGETWTELGGNTLGEFQLQILLEKIPGGKQAAEGWDGDRYEVFERDDGRLAVAWFTTWDSDEDAREFAIASAHYFAERLVRDGGDGGEGESADDLRSRCRQAFPHGEITQGILRQVGSRLEVNTTDNQSAHDQSEEGRPKECQSEAGQSEGNRGREEEAEAAELAENEERDADSPALLVEWRGADVGILFGFSQAESNTLQDPLWTSQKAELRLER
jgi:hypothetical protein